MTDDEYRWGPIAPRRRDTSLTGRVAYAFACIGAFWPLARSIYYIGYARERTAGLPLNVVSWIFAVMPALAIATGLLALKGKLRLARLAPYASAAIIVGILDLMGFMVAATDIEFDGQYILNPTGRNRACLSNIKQLGLGILMYSEDADGNTPPRTIWNEAIYPYLKNEYLYRCPQADDKETPSYGASAQILQHSINAIEAPDKCPMLFDSVPGRDLFGGQELLPNPPRHPRDEPRYHNISFADGHTKSVDQHDIQSLIWKPKFKPLSKAKTPK